MRWFLIVGLLLIGTLITPTPASAQEPTGAVGVRWVYSPPEGGGFNSDSNTWAVSPRFYLPFADSSADYNLDNVTFTPPAAELGGIYELDVATGIPHPIETRDAFQPKEHIYGDLILRDPDPTAALDSEFGMGVRAVDRATGELVWETEVYWGYNYSNGYDYNNIEYVVTPTVILIIFNQSQGYTDYTTDTVIARLASKAKSRKVKSPNLLKGATQWKPSI